LGFEPLKRGGALAIKLVPNARQTYGWKRATILASFANALLLLLVAMGGLAWEAIGRLMSSLTTAESLNRDCFCRTLNMDRLREQLESAPSLKGMMENIRQSRPNLFSSTVVFVSHDVQRQIEATVSAIERVAALPGYQAQALSRADASAQHDFGPLGVCMGYDFHLSAQGPQLIEINTNAGGLLLNVALARAQEACCKELDWAFSSNARRDTLKKSVFDMFAAEWQLQRGAAPWRSVVIVDHAPLEQYLAPEFELFRQLFAQCGVTAAIADPSELSWQNGKLWHQGAPVDMVYNRLTDFYLTPLSQQSCRLHQPPTSGARTTSQTYV